MQTEYHKLQKEHDTEAEDHKLIEEHRTQEYNQFKQEKVLEVSNLKGKDLKPSGYNTCTFSCSIQLSMKFMQLKHIMSSCVEP